MDIDGSCIGTPARTGFGGLIRNNAGFYMIGFSGFLPPTAAILEAELTAILHGITVAQDMGFQELVCYSDSLISLNLIAINSSKYHVHAILIQDIKDKLSHMNWSLIPLSAKGIIVQIFWQSYVLAQMTAFCSIRLLPMIFAPC